MAPVADYIRRCETLEYREAVQNIRIEISHLIQTSVDYGAPFSSIEVDTLKTFSDINGDSKKNLAAEFMVPKLDCKVSKDEQIKQKKVTKRIHFMRHGEGHHNVRSRQWKEMPNYSPEAEGPLTVNNDPQFIYLDATLTIQGEQQALALRDYIVQNCSACTLLVLSPMTRATQTGLLAFSKEIEEFRSITNVPLNIVAKEEAHERSDPNTCNKRLDLTELKKFFYETHAEKYGNMLKKAGYEIDYTEVLSESDPIWNGGLGEDKISAAKRGCRLLKWIYDLDDMEIVIAGHSALFTCIFETFTLNNPHFNNGEIKSCNVTFNLI